MRAWTLHQCLWITWLTCFTSHTYSNEHDVYADPPPQEIKRWGGNRMPAWGKRADQIPYIFKRWGNNKMSAWGKRDDIAADGLDNQWGGMPSSVYDKRATNLENVKPNEEVVDDALFVGDRNEIDRDKKWGSQRMSAWGKRDDTNKRWNNKAMSAWGKRDDMTKKWNNKAMSAWGKRDSDDYDALYQMANQADDFDPGLKRWYNNISWLHDNMDAQKHFSSITNTDQDLNSAKRMFNTRPVRKTRSLADRYSSVYDMLDEPETTVEKRGWLWDWTKRTKWPKIGPKRGWSL